MPRLPCWRRLTPHRVLPRGVLAASWNSAYPSRHQAVSPKSQPPARRQSPRRFALRPASQPPPEPSRTLLTTGTPDKCSAARETQIIRRACARRRSQGFQSALIAARLERDRLGESRFACPSLKTNALVRPFFFPGQHSPCTVRNRSRAALSGVTARKRKTYVPDLSLLVFKCSLRKG
jgi:hypothetical protein